MTLSLQVGSLYGGKNNKMKQRVCAGKRLKMAFITNS